MLAAVVDDELTAVTRVYNNEMRALTHLYRFAAEIK
jgi:hypothetical protein